MELHNWKKAASIAGDGTNADYGVMTRNNDSAGASSGPNDGNAKVNGNTTIAGAEAVTEKNASAEVADTPLCSWPICKGLMARPICCMQEGCMGTLHHCCLIEWLDANGYPEFNLKRCYKCWQEMTNK